MKEVQIHVDPETRKVVGSDERIIRSPDEVDYSLSNPKKGVEGIETAVITGDFQLASRIAKLIGHESDPDYVLPFEQHFAYGLKYYILGEREQALHELAVAEQSKPKEWVASAIGGLRAILFHNQSLFEKSIMALLDWHKKEYKKKAHANDPRQFLSLPGLMLMALAKREGLNITVESQYLSTEVLE